MDGVKIFLDAFTVRDKVLGAFSVDAQTFCGTRRVYVRAEKDKLPSAPLFPIFYDLPDVLGRIFSAGILFSVRDDDEHDLVCPLILNILHLFVVDSVYRITDRVEERRGPAGEVFFLRDRLYRFDFQTVVE